MAETTSVTGTGSTSMEDSDDTNGQTLRPNTILALKKLRQISKEVALLDPVLREQASSLLLEQEFSHVGPKAGANPGDEVGKTVGRVQEFSSLVEKWTPANGNEWALLAAYHLSKEKVDGVVTGQEVNSLLKQHGVGRGNITKSIGRLIGADPALMLQVRKDGTSRQARKSYKVTTSGVAFVESHLKDAGGGNA